jgi:enoyl-CoA hydratase/carnithine racemase
MSEKPISRSIEIDIDGPIAIMTVSRPDRLNALDLDMLKALGAACDEVETNADIRVAIITGDGKAFSAGGDIKAWGGMARRNSAMPGCAMAIAYSSGWRRCACR